MTWQGTRFGAEVTLVRIPDAVAGQAVPPLSPVGSTPTRFRQFDC